MRVQVLRFTPSRFEIEVLGNCRLCNGGCCMLEEIQPIPLPLPLPNIRAPSLEARGRNMLKASSV